MLWIPCNLPWSRLPPDRHLPNEPFLSSERFRAQFGKSLIDVEGEIGRGKLAGMEPHLLQALQELRNKMYQWEEEQPERLQYKAECQKVIEQIAADEAWIQKNTFCGRELNFPGVLIELQTGERVLLGHADADGSRLEGKIEVISHYDIVARYMVLDLPGLEQLTEETKLQLHVLAANDLRRHRTLEGFKERARLERWDETSGAEACERLGFRPCSMNPKEAVAAEEALRSYLATYHQLLSPTP